jgi:hypothetical protein
MSDVIRPEPGPWADRFRDLPRFPTPPGVLTPQFDGDMALLDEQADRVLQAVEAGGQVGHLPGAWPIYDQAVHTTLIDALDVLASWSGEVDPATELLAAWIGSSEGQAAA